MPDEKRSASDETSRTKRGLDVAPQGRQTEDAHKLKRVRVSRACDQCRAGREKCDGTQPICHTCQSQRRSCSYNEQPKKRGIQPHYIRTLELTLAWVLKTFPQSETRLSGLLPDPHGSAHRLIGSKDTAASDTLHNAWRNSIVCRQIDQLLSGSTIELPGTNSLACYTGTTFEQLSPLSQDPDLRTVPLDSFEPALGLPNDDLVFQEPSSDSSVSYVRLPSNAWALLEHFFAFTHAWLPIIEKHDILKLMYSYPPEGLPKAGAKSAEHAELWSIMTLATFQTSYANSDENDLDLFRCVAKDLIPSEYGPFEIGHTKALLVLCLLEVEKKTWLAAWLLVGYAIRILTHISTVLGTHIMTSRYHHTLLAAFVLESAISSQIGAPPHLQRREVEAVGLLVEDGLEEWSPWHDPNPESSTSTVAARSPARTISSFNTLVRAALTYHEAMHGGHSLSEDSLSLLFGLSHNACKDHARRQPSAIVAEMAHISLATDPASASGGENVGSSPMMDRTAEMPTPLEASTLPKPDQPGLLLDQHYPFMSIPTATSMTGSTNTSPNLWETNHAAAEGPQEPSADIGVDIFEEFALLDRTDSSSHPHFMQNLGFGPDFDLAEFFGADYQPSDPTLAYIHTSKSGG